MSSAGQVVGGVVGAVVGFFASGFNPTGALYGAQIGMMAGGYLDPPKGPTIEGPRLNDLTVQTSTYGAVIPRAYGTVTVNGNIIWLENNALKETVTKSKSGGKGGGSKSTSRTYTYSATFAVGLCKGPIAGVRRIWIGPDMIYDAGSSDPDTIAASNAAVDGFAIYLGDDTQAADPRIEATMGAGTTPAWRGLAYIVFYDLALARYANTLAGAQVRVEIMQLGATYDYPVTAQAMPATRSWIATAWNGSIYCSVAQSSNKCATSADGISWVEHDLPVSATWVDIASNGDVFVLIALHAAVVYVSDDGVTWASYSLPASGVYAQVVWGGDKFLAVRDTGNWASSGDGIYWIEQTAPAAGLGLGSGSYAKSLSWNGSMWACVSQFGTKKIFTSPTGLAGSWTDRLNTAGGGWANSATKAGRFCIVSNGGSGSYISDDGISWTRSTTPSAVVNSVAADSRAFVSVGTSNYHVSYDGQTWTTQAMPHITTWGSVCWNGAVFHIAARNNAWAATIQPVFVTSLYPTLGDVVSAECLQSGLLDSGDIDVTALTTEVRGYRIGSLGAIRAALEPLQGAWPFDVVQHGYTLRFVQRGGSSVVTIPAADLDARAAGNGPGVQITTSREMDSQLPQRVTIKHLDYSREYDTGSQYAERLTTSAINALVLDLPIVLTATEAAGKAEVLLYLYWLERYDVSIVMPPTYNQLEPGDVVTLTTPEGNVSLRLTSISYTSDGRLECQAKYNSAAIYTPTAVAADPVYTGPTTIQYAGATKYVLLDIPMVVSSQNTPCILVAACGATSTWPGGTLLTSLDGGSSWSAIADLPAPGSTMGIATTALGSVDSRVIDNASELAVTLDNGELFSVTESAILNGANYFAYGADGRWEIIAAQTCTLVGGSSYILRDFLRARRGTEFAMSLHAVGDSVVLLDTSTVQLLNVELGTLGQSRLYRAITDGRDISTDANRSFAYQGVNLKPLTPYGGNMARNTTTDDLTLYAYRRSRIVDEWRDYVDIDIGESVEAYEWDVCTDNTYTVVLRTLSATGTNSVLYSAAEQVADFGSVQTTLSFVIYQISASVGRGNPTYRTYNR
jgi:hypothetical protein